ncbi:cyclic nucleotide-binding domain-containing protein [Thermaurantiacus tibetensis]|uniref:cyclic nucleotide-binding domain-containing protein n=1 Tax=Thermaurantiacus tibetensis TaxID=2759035 RepID=UPI002E2DBFD9|nr:cyclic nucleotide-binding domain-containing protein [Thermaurantiacus tibetensis]
MEPSEELLDVAIVGSGPAGLAAAARAARRGMRHLLLEKTDHLADTIFRYQKGKHVMATPPQLLLRCDLAFEAGARETVLARWAEDAAAAGIAVRHHAEVTEISGTRGDFTLGLADGTRIRAAHVVLAIGTQGNPNLLKIPGVGAPGAPVVQYTLDDPAAFVDEHIVVVGSGDAGIENALGLAADPAQGNHVTLLNRSADFAKAKDANVKALMAARDAGRIAVLTETAPNRLEAGHMVVDTRDGEARLRCDRVIARLGSAPPRAFVEKAGVAFTSAAREAFPLLSPQFETSVPGLHVIGALAGYPLIKHCLNQGHDVIEFIAGNTDLRPADEPILERVFAGLQPARPVDDWIAFLRARVSIFRPVSPLQMRELLLDATVRRYAAGEVVFVKNDVGASLFAIAEGAVEVEIDPGPPRRTATIGEGSIVGEVGLISGRRRGATVRAATPAILVELPRTAALRLIGTVPDAGAEVDRITTTRLLLQIFQSGLVAEDLAPILETARTVTARAGEAIVTEGETGDDMFVIRRGSCTVEKRIGGRPVFLRYLPAGSYFGEMAVLDGTPRTATVRAAIRSELIRLDGAAFRRLFEARPELRARTLAEMAARRALNAFIEERKDRFGSAVDLYSETAAFLVENGLGEATDALLIDERLCVGCDNCEKACADSHDGLSRLDREAGRTFAYLHVPTSCRHCEHPHCMTDCPPDAIRRGPDGEVSINDSCIGCGNCVRHCPYGVIRMDSPPPRKPGLLSWLLLGRGPGPGEPPKAWAKAERARLRTEAPPKKAVKCDMCAGKAGGPACVRACPTGAAIRVSPETFLALAGRRD